MSTRFVPRSDTLEDVIEKFHIAFVDMLVGKMDEGKFVNKGDMYKAMQAVSPAFLLRVFTPRMVARDGESSGGGGDGRPRLRLPLVVVVVA
ncbi:hypothetical protein K443DRAFT_12924 [Laccaria amethystina LaAM-08-1]|uniref:Uncharacterized protein n=1 Tax=Laccaria amethystina LaAM-08-1 TaxID=1095629 RepID=A0A0C9WIQ8_9AGAR|nr:hypothetical protein K443DRAFT_12924 [Laccaria amethystina LaAM-08-1]